MKHNPLNNQDIGNLSFLVAITIHRNTQIFI